MLWEYLKRHEELFDSKPTRLMHIAPEPAIRKFILGRDNVDYLGLSGFPNAILGSFGVFRG